MARSRSYWCERVAFPTVQCEFIHELSSLAIGPGMDGHKINSTCLLKTKMNVFDKAIMLHHRRIGTSISVTACHTANSSQLANLLCVRAKCGADDAVRGDEMWRKDEIVRHENTWINHLCSCEKDKPFYICIFCAQLRVARCFKYTVYVEHALQTDPSV